MQQQWANIPDNKSEKLQILMREEIRSSVSIPSLDTTGFKRRTFGVNEIASEGSLSPLFFPKKTNQVQSPSRNSHGRASLMSPSPLFPSSTKLRTGDFRAKNQNQEIVEMMKRSILELKTEGSLNKEDLIKSLISGKFTASQALEVITIRKKKAKINFLRFLLLFFNDLGPKEAKMISAFLNIACKI